MFGLQMGRMGSVGGVGQSLASQIAALCADQRTRNPALACTFQPA